MKSVKFYSVLVALGVLPFLSTRHTVIGYLNDYLTSAQLTAFIALDVLMLIPVVFFAICGKKK